MNIFRSKKTIVATTREVPIVPPIDHSVPDKSGFRYNEISTSKYTNG